MQGRNARLTHAALGRRAPLGQVWNHEQNGEKPVSLEQLEAGIRGLNLKERAALAKWIIQSLDELVESEIV